MKISIAAAFGAGLLGLTAFAAAPAMAGITPEQEAAQLDQPTPKPSTPPQAATGEEGASWPYAFNGTAQRRIETAHHFGNLDQIPRSASELP